MLKKKIPNLLRTNVLFFTSNVFFSFLWEVFHWYGVDVAAVALSGATAGL